MTEFAISVRNLSKQYRLGTGAANGGYRLFTEDLMAWFRPRRQPAPRQQRESLFWALQDISFDVRPGEVVGVIGNNGAGKSTLLKILSRITEPTQGRAVLNGRIASLLEVGTGFHPELTGRENVFLNGAIMGMRRAEIQRKFDEIVAFAEVEQFIDTPVKRYSSGMYMRLAFSVAAHLEAEILLVDEVLAVGDSNFQKKSLGKMGDVASSGRTVLLVSHNMASIKALTQTCLLLEGGHLKLTGPSKAVVDAYLGVKGSDRSDGVFAERALLLGRLQLSKYHHQVLVKSITLRDAEGDVSGIFLERSTVLVEIELDVTASIPALEIRLFVKSVDGQTIFTCWPEKQESELAPGLYRVGLAFNLGPLLPGYYNADILVLSHIPQDRIQQAFHFEVAPNVEGDQLGSDNLTRLSAAEGGSAFHAYAGFMRVECEWQQTARIEPASQL